MSESNLIEVPQQHFSRREERPGVGAMVPANMTPMQIVAMAVAQGEPIEKLEKLMALSERHEANEARKAFNAAFAAFKEEAVRVTRNRKVTAGPLSGKSYAELFSVVNAVTPALSKHGLSVSWKLTKDDKDWLEVTCTMKHALGHSEVVAMGGPPDAGGAKSALQARASTVTYLERYTLKAICGVSEEGDDNDGAAGDKKPEPDAAGKVALEKCASVSSLAEAWKGLTAAQRHTLAGVKEECKARIQAADRAAQ